MEWSICPLILRLTHSKVVQLHIRTDTNIKKMVDEIFSLSEVKGWRQPCRKNIPAAGLRVEDVRDRRDSHLTLRIVRKETSRGGRTKQGDCCNQEHYADTTSHLRARLCGCSELTAGHVDLPGCHTLPDVSMQTSKHRYMVA